MLLSLSTVELIILRDKALKGPNLIRFVNLGRVKIVFNILFNFVSLIIV